MTKERAYNIEKVSDCKQKTTPNVQQSFPHLPTKGLEVASIEILGQDLLREGIGGKQDQESSSPFDNARILFHHQHVMKATDELVETNRTSNTNVGSRIRKSDSGGTVDGREAWYIGDNDGACA